MAESVRAVHLSNVHAFSKDSVETIHLLQGLGIEGDAHCGVTVKHRSRVAQDPTQPNLRQVHLIQSELFQELRSKGHQVNSGELGENITTIGIYLLQLPQGAKLHIGESAVVTITGLRNPCAQIEAFQSGLLFHVLDREPDGALIRKSGVMGIVSSGGHVRAGDEIVVSLPSLPHKKLERV